MLKKILYGFLGVILVFIMLIVLAMSPVGLKVGLQVAKHYIPGELSYASVHGDITGPILLEQVQYKNNHVNFKAKSLVLRWHLWELLRQHNVHIKELVANKVEVKVSGMDKVPEKVWKILGGKDNVHSAIFLHKLSVYGILNKHNSDLDIKAQVVDPASLNINLKVTGNLDHYKLKLNLKNKNINWDVKGEGDLQHIALTIPEKQAIAGHPSGILNFTWSPYLHWDTNFNFSQLPVQHMGIKNLDKVDFSLNSKGSWYNHKLALDFAMLLRSQDGSIKLDGNYHNSWNVNWQISLRNLHKHLDGAYGAIQSHGQVTGKLAHPQIKGLVQINNLNYSGVQAGFISAKVNLDTSLQRPLDINISANNFRYNNYQFHTISISAQDYISQHKIAVGLIADKYSTNLRLDGGWKNNQWQGKLQQLQIKANKFGVWRLSQPVDLLASDQQVSLSKLCLVNSNQLVCLDGNWLADKPWSLNLTGKEISMLQLSHLLHKHITVNGVVSINANVTGDGKQLQHAKARAIISNSVIAVGGESGLKTKPLHTVIDMALDKNGVSVKLNLHSQNKDTIAVALQLPGYNKLQKIAPSQPVTGQAQLNIKELNDLNIIDALIPRIDAITGGLTANLALHGTINNPQLTGYARWHKGGIEVPRVGVSLTNIELKLNANNQAINYTATALSHGTPIKLSGKASLQGEKFATSIKVTGTNVLVVDTAEYMIKASPDMEISTDGETIHFTGKIKIPEAMIKPQDFTNVVTIPEEDLVIIGEDNQALKEKGWGFFYNLHITMGDNVRIDTSGITGKVVGGLHITGSPDNPVTATGKILLEDGKFNAYGYNLKIMRNSAIVYTNSPINNPILSLKAIRTIQTGGGVGGGSQQLGQDDIVVGVAVSGSLTHRRTTLFAIPGNLSQADILSYLVLGTASSSESGANYALLVQAVTSLQMSGADGKEGVVQQLQNRFGFSEFGVENIGSGGDTLSPLTYQQTSFVIGKKLWRQLYVRYIQGLALDNTDSLYQPTSILQVQYYITPKWVVQGSWNPESDSDPDKLNTLNSGVDVFYSFER